MNLYEEDKELILMVVVLVCSEPLADRHTIAKGEKYMSKKKKTKVLENDL